MRRFLAPGVLAAFASALMIVSPGRVQVVTAQDGDDDGGDSRVRIGLAIAPVPLDLQGRNRALVGLGSYIVNGAGDCNGCHTKNFDPYLPGGNPFNGEPESINPDNYLVGGSDFGGIFSRNLRPDPVTGRPAGYTLREFKRVMRTGADLKQVPPHVPGPDPDNDLLQIMPWPSFAKLNDHDLRAIYEYLRALPPAP